jgi:hypothetical protein
MDSHDRHQDHSSSRSQIKDLSIAPHFMQPSSHNAPMITDSDFMPKRINLGAGMHHMDMRAVAGQQHMVQLENLMAYLMGENNFFKCLQVEVYLYFMAFIVFLYLARDEIIVEEQYPRFIHSTMSFILLYIYFLIKNIHKVQRNIDATKSWYRIAAAACYLVFIVVYDD